MSGLQAAFLAATTALFGASEPAPATPEEDLAILIPATGAANVGGTTVAVRPGDDSPLVIPQTGANRLKTDPDTGEPLLEAIVDPEVEAAYAGSVNASTLDPVNVSTEQPDTALAPGKSPLPTAKPGGERGVSDVEAARFAASKAAADEMNAEAGKTIALPKPHNGRCAWTCSSSPGPGS